MKPLLMISYPLLACYFHGTVDQYHAKFGKNPRQERAIFTICLIIWDVVINYILDQLVNEFGVLVTL